MKNIIFLMMTLLMACDGNETVNQSKTDNFKAAMAYGSITELNNLDSNIEKNLHVRLYKIPLADSACFVETHGVCQNKYLISVSTLDEYPEFNVFELSTRGDISRIKWLKANKTDSVELEFIFDKYTTQAIKNNPALSNTQIYVKLKLGITEILEVSHLHRNL